MLVKDLRKIAKEKDMPITANKCGLCLKRKGIKRTCLKNILTCEFCFRQMKKLENKDPSIFEQIIHTYD